MTDNGAFWKCGMMQRGKLTENTCSFVLSASDSEWLCKWNFCDLLKEMLTRTICGGGGYLVSVQGGK